MNKSLMHRVVVLVGLAAALCVFVWNMSSGGDLLYSAFCALAVFLGVSLAFLMALKSVAKALLRHLQERRRLQQASEMEELRRQAIKQQQQKGQGQAPSSL